MKKAQEYAITEDLIIPENILNIQKLVGEKEKKLNMRSKEVLSKYSELMRGASRDENTLIQLQNVLRGVLLEEAKSDNYWQQIAEPTLDKEPIEVDKIKTASFGLIIGSFFGMIIAYIKERRSGYIYHKKSLEKYLNQKLYMN